MKKKTIIIPLPNQDFDPSEVSISWKIICQAGHEVEFATVDGQRGYADPLMISGEGLDPWGWLPGFKKFKLVGLLLRADRFGRADARRCRCLRRGARASHVASARRSTAVHAARQRRAL